MSYESPIHLITDRMRIETEGEIIKATQRVGIYVDKDELLKALAYDRDQYLKGYEDRDNELVRCKDCKHYLNEHICMYFSRHGTIETSSYAYCAYGERREHDDKNTAEDKEL